MLSKSVASLAAFTAVLDDLPSPIALADFDSGLLVYLNPSAEKLFGRSSSSVQGKPQSILHPPLMNTEEKNTFIRHRYQLEHEGRILPYENIALNSSGRKIPVEITANLITLNQQRLMVGIFISIEQRQRALKALSQKEALWQAIFDTSQVGIFIVDEQRYITHANQHTADMFGYQTPAELLNQSVEILHASHDSYLTFGEQYFSSMVDHRALQIEFQMRKKNGEVFWCRISGKAIDHAVPANLSRGIVWVIDDISTLKETETALRAERNLFTGGPTTILQWCPEEGWPVVYASENATQMLGYSLEELKAPNFKFTSLIHPNDRARVKSEVSNFLNRQAPSFEQTYRLLTRFQEYRNFYDYSQVEYSPTGEPIKIYGYLIDMTEHFRAQEMTHLLLAHSNEGIFGIDSEGKTSFVNPAAAKMLGYTQEELIGRANHSLIHHSAHGKAILDNTCRMSMPIKTGEEYHVTDEVLWRKDGSSFAVEYWSSPIMQDNHVIGAVVTFHDISKRLEQEQKINHLAFHDALTDLPNRRQLMHNLKTELAQEKHDAQRASLLLLDIDHFKDVNDSLGHPIGDELLKTIVGRISKLLRSEDFFARLGGDEFAILITNDIGELHALSVAERIINSFKNPFQVQRHAITSNTSIGISFLHPSLSADQIITQADVALYDAKNKGRGSFAFYQPEMSDKVNADLILYNGLTKALSSAEFKLYYQLQFDALTHRAVGAEMLIRWFPTQPLLTDFTSPAYFIPIAEKRGLLHPIALWQLERLGADIAALKRAGLMGPVSMNISGSQLTHIEQLVELVEKIENQGIAFTDIEFEITETTYANLSDETKKLLESLIRQGLNMAIDDFGTGYSSLVALRELSSHLLKIDKQFIDEVVNNEDDRAIVAATISMAHALGKRVVAEGVETAQQLHLLQQLNCDIIQGYYFARPLPLEEAIARIQNTPFSKPNT